MSEIKCLYGFNKTAYSLHHVEEAIQDRSLELVCPACMKKLTPVNGKIIAKHFRHDSSDHDNHCSESALHIRAITIISKMEFITLPVKEYVSLLHISDSGQFTHQQVTNVDQIEGSIKFAQLELRMTQHGLIPDCTIKVDFGDGSLKTICVEVYVSHAIDQEKLEKIKKADTLFVEVDLSETVRDISDDDLAIKLSNKKNYVIKYTPYPLLKLVTHVTGDMYVYHSKLAELKYCEYLQNYTHQMALRIPEAATKINIFDSKLGSSQWIVPGLSFGIISARKFILNDHCIEMSSDLGDFSHSRSSTPYPTIDDLLKLQVSKKISDIKRQSLLTYDSMIINELSVFCSEIKPPLDKLYLYPKKSPVSFPSFKSKHAKDLIAEYGDELLFRMARTIESRSNNGSFLPLTMIDYILEDLKLPSFGDFSKIKARYKHLQKNLDHDDGFLDYDPIIKKNYTNTQFKRTLPNDVMTAFKKTESLIKSLNMDAIEICAINFLKFLEHNGAIALETKTCQLSLKQNSLRHAFERYIDENYLKRISKIHEARVCKNIHERVIAMNLASDVDLIFKMYPNSNLGHYLSKLDEIAIPKFVLNRILPTTIVRIRPPLLK